MVSLGRNEVECYASLRSKKKSYYTYGMYIKSIPTYTLRFAQLPLYLFSFVMVDDLRSAPLRYLLSFLFLPPQLRFAPLKEKSIITYLLI